MDDAETDSEGRKYQTRIAVRPFPHERAILEAQCKMAGIKHLSEFLLKAGLGVEFRSAIDIAKTEELLHAAGDIGRVGGLLKLWLSKEGPWWEGDVPKPREIRKIVKELVEAQRRLIELIDRMSSRF